MATHKKCLRHNWFRIREMGGIAYDQCNKCGKRDGKILLATHVQPDAGWLGGGEFTDQKKKAYAEIKSDRNDLTTRKKRPI